MYHIQIKFILGKGIEDLLASRIITRTPIWELRFQVVRFEVPLQRIFIGIYILSCARIYIRITKAYQALKSTFTFKRKAIQYFRIASYFRRRFTKIDTFLQYFRYPQIIETESHLKGLDTILKQLSVTDLIYIPIFKFKVYKSFSLRNNMRYIELEGKGLSLVISLDDAVSDMLKEIVILLIFSSFV